MANLNLNKVILGGRLVADPELKQTNSGISVLSGTIAVNRPYAKKNEDNGQPTADFIRFTAWRQTAEFISRFFRKGSCICVVGSIQTRTWTDQQNQKRYETEVVVDEAMFVDSKGEGPQITGSAPVYPAGNVPDNYTAPSLSNSQASAPKFEELTSDDDLPF